MSHQNVASYLERLTGTALSPTIRLSSAQRAAFAAWARREGIPFSQSVLLNGTFSLAELLGDIGPPVSVDLSWPNAAMPSSGLAVGIDLELVSSLPDATDYREHEFYQENFTSEEIAYCLQRPNPKSSLCGLWAAKEAIVKALNVPTRGEGMKSLEIRHDEAGRPFFDGGALSISHAGDFCVAIFTSFKRGSRNGL
jgi:phosphopantetheinyl transferase (holo-ACP synthase)